MIENTALVVIALGLVLLNGFFVAAEFAIVKLRTTRIEELQAAHGWRGAILGRIHGKLDAYLSACQLGITLASLGLGWIGEPAFARLLEAPVAWLGLDVDPQSVHTAAFVFAFTLISFLHIVVGELAPKTMAIRQPEAVSLWTAVPLWLFYWLMYPFIWVLNASANALLRLTGLGGLDAHAHEPVYSMDELRSILHLSRPASGGTETAIKSVLSHALELPDLHVSDLMRPMRELVAICDDASYDDVRRLIRKQRYSRYPLLAGQARVLGILHIKDLLLEDDAPGFSSRLVRWLHEPIRVAENASVADLLKRFLQGATHFALVVDDHEDLSGFLTLEDVLEAIFGEITDEHEKARPHQVRRNPQREADGSLLARGETALFLVERELGRAIAGSEEIGTLAGLLMRQLDRMPQSGDVVEHDGLRFEVARVRGPRVEAIRVREVARAGRSGPSGGR